MPAPRLMAAWSRLISCVCPGVRVRRARAPDLLRAPPAPARRLAGRDHRGDPGAGERGRPGGRTTAPRRPRRLGTRGQGLLEPGLARRTRPRRARPDRAPAGEEPRGGAVAGAAGPQAAPDGGPAGPARRALPRQAGTGAGRVALVRAMAAQGR